MKRVPKGKRDEPLEIIWEDASSNDEWKTPSKGRLLKVLTVGYLVHECKDRVCVVQNMTDDSVSCSMTIPRSTITSMRRFKRGKKNEGRR